MRGSSAVLGADQVGGDVAGTGCSRLCFVLAGFGLGLTAAATLFTYRVLHEQMESLGASVVDHMASSKCTAISKVLASLSVARSDVLNGEIEQERTVPAPSTVIGVVTTGSWELEDYHANGISQAQALAVLQALPPRSMAADLSVATAIAQASQPTLADLEASSCNLGYGLNPMAVRVHAIPALAVDQTHHDHSHHQAHDDRGGQGAPGTQQLKPASGSSAWLAFLYGPWPAQGRNKVAFALVDLNAATLQASGHDHSLNDLFPSGSGQMDMGVDVSPASVLKDQRSLHRAMPFLDEEDHKLLGLKVVPFANQVLRSEMSIDHGRLDRMPRRSAALVFLIGLLATSAVVLVSRSSEVRLRRLNQALLEESRTDGLTRVANRRAWDEALCMEESRRQRYGHIYGLVVVDLDGFKQINDLQGHQAGDQVLRTTAAELAQQLRGTDLLARVGGDEFALLIFSPTPEGLRHLTERLSITLHEKGIQASIGAAMSEGNATLDQTWAKADEAMYKVKCGAFARSPLPTELP